MGTSVAVLLGLVVLGTVVAVFSMESKDAGHYFDDDAVTAVKVGTCTGAIKSDKDDQVRGVDIVSCERKHAFEAFASLRLTEESFPGDDKLRTRANDFCAAQFSAFVGIPPRESEYDLRFLLPTDASWRSGGDHEIVCLVGDDQGGVTGSLKGVRR